MVNIGPVSVTGLKLLMKKNNSTFFYHLSSFVLFFVFLYTCVSGDLDL